MKEHLGQQDKLIVVDNARRVNSENRQRPTRMENDRAPSTYRIIKPQPIVHPRFVNNRRFHRNNNFASVESLAGGNSRPNVFKNVPTTKRRRTRFARSRAKATGAVDRAYRSADSARRARRGQAVVSNFAGRL